MSIQNELASDIAFAILTQKKMDPQRVNELKEVLLRIHLALQTSSEKSRKRRVAAAATEALTVEKRRD